MALSPELDVGRWSFIAGSPAGAHASERVLKFGLGSTGEPPVPSGDSPDGTRATNADGLFPRILSTVPVGESPALPTFKKHSQPRKKIHHTISSMGTMDSTVYLKTNPKKVGVWTRC